MANLLNNVAQLTATTGTGAVTLGAAVAGAQTFAGGGAVNGGAYSYRIDDGAAWELGEGVYTASGTTLSRSLVSSSTGSLLALTGAATVSVLALVSDHSIGRQSIWIPAGAMTPRTTNGAAVGTVETATNLVMIRTLDFDTTTVEFAQFTVAMPKSWDEGVVQFQPLWSHAATTVNFGVVFALAAVAVGNDDALDVAFGTAVLSADTGGTTHDIYAGPESGAVTVSGSPVEMDTVLFQISRVVADAGDTMAIDARLHGVRLFYNVNNGNDS
jgi:hypothetical protein